MRGNIQLSKNSAIMLTGATGFLGASILRQLLASGRSVVAVVRHNSQYDRITDVLSHSNLIRVENTPEKLNAAFEQNRIRTIIHTATEYGRGEGSVANILDSNLILPIRLAELGVKHGAHGFINTDSYFNKPGGSYSNLLNYSLSKRTLLTWLEKFSPRLNVANVILEHMYGPYDSRTKFVENMVRSIAIERTACLDMTYGHQKRDFIFITDVVDAFMKILEHMEQHAFPFKVFEVGFGRSMQIRDFVKAIADISGSSTQLNFGAIEYRDDEMMNSRADIRGLLDLGWTPAVEPEEGIRKIIKTYRSVC